ncbi:mitochondrial import receptor subunit Tom22 [Vanrija albida]|uniref:Mitochondrial import receptor subunit Tom22 n=1 Tax=Vanrija albida TaxID=181172 RepID=A0ABR3Q2W7_9TREE
MVLVEEVQEDIVINERESDFETESEASDDASVLSDDDFDPSEETFGERIAALKDIVPPETRTSLANGVQTIKEWAAWAVNGSGQIAWWATTSALLVGLPLALAIEDEARITQQEREMQMQSQGQQQLLGGQQGGNPTGVVPAGF